MSRKKNYLLLIFLAAILTQNVYSQEKESKPWVAFLHFKVGVYPSVNSWDYTPPVYTQGVIYNPAQDWEPTNGIYKKNISFEDVFEVSKPLWGMQLNFGFKPVEIQNNESNEITKFNSNYFAFSMLFFPMKQERKIHPFILAKAGINFQHDYLEHNGKLLSIGAGVRMFFAKQFGFELILERQTLKYKEIYLGNDITDYFVVHPVKISLGLVYKI